MKLYLPSTFALLFIPRLVSGESLQEAIIKDMMPERSPLCNPTPGATSSDFTFASSQEESKWFDGYAESYEKYNAPWSNLEHHVFNAKMMHTDSNNDRKWTIRLGKGGNIYSMVGPMGETVAPQKRIDSPWIDEVWHSVGVEPPQPEEPFMIHGAGSYQSDQTYTSDVGVPLTEVPFYSPSLGKYCNDSDGECGFAAWAQHGPVPVYWKSDMLNFNRYVDCGDGVIEHTAVSHNNMGSEKNLMRLDAPFGSVRFSTFRDVVISDQTSEILFKNHELGRFDTAPEKVAASDTLGYAIFAEDLPSPVTGPYPLKAGVSMKIHNVGCRNAPTYVSPYPAVMCRLEPTEPDSEGTRVAVTFRGTPPTFSAPCSDNDATNCIDAVKFMKYGSNNYCRAFGSGGDVMCRLNHVFLNNFRKHSGSGQGIKFETASGLSFSASNGITYWSFESNGVYSMIFTPRSGVDPTLTEIDLMITDNPNEEWNISLLSSPDVGGDVAARNGVINWVLHIQETGAQWIIFNPDEVEGESDLGRYVARKYPPGTSLEVLYHEGKPEEENLALAHVYGNSFPDTDGLTPGFPLLQVGNANEGFMPRDANIYNIVTTASKNSGGGSHVYRQYFVMDRFTNISEKAANLVSQVYQQNYNVNNDADATPTGRLVHLYKQGNNIGATIGDTPCYGAEIPFPYPTDDAGNTIILQSRGGAGVHSVTDRLGKCVLTVAMQQGLTGAIRGGPTGKQLVLNFYTSDGHPTGENYLVDGIRHWYWKSNRMLVYPSEPLNTVEACPDAEVELEAKFPVYNYINVTYADDAYNYELITDKVCTGSTTPNKNSKALFEVKCGNSRYIGPDPYYFAPDGFSSDDQKKRPYICKNDSTARGEWRLLGFFPDGACSSIEVDYVFDKDMCSMA